MSGSEGMGSEGGSAQAGPGFRGAEPSLGAVVVVAACVLLAYGPVCLVGSWVFDDLRFLYDNPRIAKPGGLRAIWLEPSYDPWNRAGDLVNPDPHYWPILYTTFWLEHVIHGGFSAPAMRAVNLVLHMANVALLWGLLRRMGVPGAVAIALLWAIHPGHFTAVSLILHRKDVLSATFVLAALWLWFPQGRATPTLGWGRVSAVAAITMAGVLVKTPIALLPCYVAIVYWWRRGAWSPTALVRLGAVTAAGIAAGGAQWWLMQTHSAIVYVEFSAIEKALMASLSFGAHLWFSVVPWPEVVRYWCHWCWEQPTGLWFAWAALGASTALAGAVAASAWRWRTRHVMAAGLWFAVAIIAYTGIVDHHGIAGTVASPRYRYLASIGPLALVIGAAWVWLPRVWRLRYRPSAAVALAPVVAFCVVLDWEQSLIMSAPSAWTRWQMERMREPHGMRPVLAHHLAREGDLDGALEAARGGVAARPAAAWAHSTLALVHAIRGERAAARDAYRQALELAKAHPERTITRGSPELRRIPGEERFGRYFPYMLHSALLVLAECAGDGDEARRHEAEARRIDPTRDPGRYFRPAHPLHCQASLGHRRGRPE